MDVNIWRPDRLTRRFVGEYGAASWGYAVIILNVPVHDTESFTNIWNNARWRTCADGGANQICDLRKDGLSRIELQDPDLVCGDFDSIRPEVLKAFEDKGARIVKDADQSSTDLTKALKYTGEHVRQNDDGKLDVVIFGSMGGRIDQVFSQFHQLYSCSLNPVTGIVKLYMVCADSIVMLIPKGKNQVNAPQGPGEFTKYAGIIPLAGPATLTTAGFEWNLNQEQLEFGRFISTSNHIVDSLIELDSVAMPVILTLETAV